MNKKISTKDLVTSSLLIAIGILIPMIFTGPPFRIIVGPYTATLMAHVPVIISMFISPFSAIFTTIGTTIGFFFTAPLIVAVRAASHILFALIGAYMIKKGSNAILLCLVTGIIHAIFEGIVVMIFFSAGISSPNAGYSVLSMVIITAAGTFAHHIVDFVIAYIVSKPLVKSGLLHHIPKII